MQTTFNVYYRSSPKHMHKIVADNYEEHYEAIYAVMYELDKSYTEYQKPILTVINGHKQ